MPLWNIVSTYDAESVTEAFGTRQFTESEGNIFECCSLTVIRPDSEYPSVPNVKSISNGSHTCLIIDNTLTVLSGEDCKHEFSNVFESFVDCLMLSEKWNMLFLCLQDATVYGIDMESQEIVFEAILEEECKGGKRSFVNILEFLDYYVILGRTGTCYRLFKDASINHENNQESDNSIKISLQKMSDIGIKASNLNTGVICPGRTPRGLFGGEKIIMREGCETTLLDQSPIKKMYFMENEGNTMCLSESGMMFLISPSSLFIQPLPFEFEIQDFTIVNNISEDTDSFCNLVLLSKDSKRLMLMEYPSLEVKYSVEIDGSIFLIDFIGDVMELKFLEYTENNSFDKEIHVKTLSERCPEYRLQRLIRRNRFDEAEYFVRRFNLSMDVVHKARAEMELKKYWQSNEDFSKDNFHKLITLLDNISNNLCVVDCCMNVLNFKDGNTEAEKKLLSYTIERIGGSDEMSQHLRHFQDVLLKLETFEFLELQPFGFSWSEFRHSNLFEFCLVLLELGEIMKAAAIWSRHYNSFRGQITLHHVQELMDKIPKRYHPVDLLPGFKHFIPGLLQAEPLSLKLIVHWVKITALSYERTHIPEWPEIGRNFCVALTQLMQFDDNSCTSAMLSVNVELEDLMALKNALDDLITLKNLYKIHISLAKYMQDNLKNMSIALLHQVSTEYLEQFLNDFLTPRLVKSEEFELSMLIQDYIEGRLKKIDRSSNWESKMAALIKFISNEDIAMRCILLVLENARLPWSPVILSLYEQGSSTQHKSASDIKAAYRFTGVRFIMHKHDFEGIKNDYCELLLLVERILLNNFPDVMDDIFKLVEAEPSIEKMAFQTCLNHYLTKGDLKKGIEIINSLDRKKQERLSSYSLCAASSCLRPRRKLTENEIAFFQFLDYLKFSESLQDQYYMEEVDQIKKIYKLSTKYEIYLTFEDYFDKVNWDTVLKQGVKWILEYHVTFSEIYDQLIDLSKLMDIKIELAVIELCKQSRNLNLVLDCVRAMLLREQFNMDERQSDKSLIHLAAHLIHMYSKQRNDSLAMFDENSVQISLDGTFPMALELINIYMNTCSFDNCLPEYFLLAYWITIGAVDLQEDFSLLEMKMSAEKNRIPSLSNVYKDAATVSHHKNILNIISLLMGNIFSECEKDPILAGIFEKSDVDSLKYIQKVQTTQYDSIAVRLAHLLLLHNNNENNKDQLLAMLPKLLDRTLMKMVSRKKFDVEGTMSFLRLTENPQAVTENMFSQLRVSSQPTNRLLNVAILSQEYQAIAERVRHGTKYSMLLERRKCLSWALKLKEINFTMPDITDLTDWHLVVLEKLYLLPAPCSLLKEFCHDFGMDNVLENVIIKQLTHVLSNLKLKFEVTTNNYMNKEIMVTPSVQEITDICSEYLNAITNGKELVKHMKILLEQVNFYHYELYTVIIELLLKYGEEDEPYRKWLEVLKFLKQYERSVEPCKMEYDTWAQQFPNHCEISTLSKYRMPFISFTNKTFWDIIKHEISVSSCMKWLTIIKWLPLESSEDETCDRFCQYAIKNTMMALYKNCPKGEWSLTMKQEATRRECLCILGVVSDMERYSSLLYFIMNYSADGADILAASKSCYEFGDYCIQQGHKNLPVEKLQKKYPLYAVMHLLHQYKLNEPYLMDLIEDPKALIFALYNHPAVLKNSRTVIVEDPDINRVVEEIAILHQDKIDLHILKHNLLNQWIMSNSMLPSMDDTFNADCEKDLNVTHTNWDDDLLRACYILKSYERKDAVTLLGGNITDNGVNTNSIRLRSLQCLLEVAGSQTIEEVLHLNIQHQQTLLKDLSIMNYLEFLGFSYSKSEYDKLNKVPLIRHLMMNYNNNPTSIILCVQLCQTNGIHDIKTWEILLKQLIHFKMMPELNSSLNWLQSYPSLSSLPIVVEAWQCAIRTPFIEADAIRNPEQEEICAKALLKLQCCPVATSLDLIDIAECCIKAARPYMAAALLLFANDADKQKILKVIHNNSDASDLEQNVKYLEDLGILFVPQILRLISV